MSSIGNDIVDLNLIDKHRTALPKFYSKILAAPELQLYKALPLSQLPFEVFVWLLWSAKESVYKFAKRLNPELVFSPVKFEIGPTSELLKLKNFQNELSSKKFNEYENSENSGLDRFLLQATVQNKTYYTQSLITANFIATIANDIANCSTIQHDVKQINDDTYEQQSAGVREFLLTNLRGIFPGRDLQIIKSPVGYPIVLADGDDLDMTISFAHHGNYVSYAFKRV